MYSGKTAPSPISVANPLNLATDMTKSRIDYAAGECRIPGLYHLLILIHDIDV